MLQVGQHVSSSHGDVEREIFTQTRLEVGWMDLFWEWILMICVPETRLGWTLRSGSVLSVS
jgi:hypothetical protein